MRDTVAWLKRRETAQRLSGLRAPIYLPDYRPQDFVGRVAYLDLLRNTLTTEPTVFLLHGEPGSGKSTLALQFAWEAQKDFDAVIFQTCGQRPLDAITAELVERLPIDVKTRPPDEQRKEAIKWLKARQSLLVLDDVWSPEVRQLEPGPACSVLYTSRLQSLPGLAAKLSSKVEKFTEAECDDLFHATLDPLFGAEEITRHRDALLGFAEEGRDASHRRGRGREPAARKSRHRPRQRRKEAQARGAYRWRQRRARTVPQGHRVAARSRAEAAGRLCRVRAGGLLVAPRRADCRTHAKTMPRTQPVCWRMPRCCACSTATASASSCTRCCAIRCAPGRTAMASASCRSAMRLRWRNCSRIGRLRWQDCRECLEEIIAGDKVPLTTGKMRAQAGSVLRLRVANRSANLTWHFASAKQRSHLPGWPDKDALQRSYGNQALILQAWGRLDDALALHKKEEAICLELGNQDGLQASYGNQALILQAWGRLDDALALHKKEEAICLELGNQDSLQAATATRR